MNILVVTQAAGQDQAQTPGHTRTYAADSLRAVIIMFRIGSMTAITKYLHAFPAQSPACSRPRQAHLAITGVATVQSRHGILIDWAEAQRVMNKFCAERRNPLLICICSSLILTVEKIEVAKILLMVFVRCWFFSNFQLVRNDRRE